MLGAGGVLKAGKEEVAQAQYPPFFRDAARLEAEAIQLHVYAWLGATHVRDSKDKAGPVVSLTPDAWAEFVGFAAQHTA